MPLISQSTSVIVPGQLLGFAILDSLGGVTGCHSALEGDGGLESSLPSPGSDLPSCLPAASPLSLSFFSVSSAFATCSFVLAGSAVTAGAASASSRLFAADHEGTEPYTVR